eukprot:CAMPEP_0117738898 /NCGR_PEP_ID=MMETSP0947-20121206/3414_1 /TAXON_ID=44440 /ORGANISM="Chattonella subsalsa, Strain CCMP2191" /LENGTH=936 /DNA_ID=CAMNT_0005554697 /DNA_START=250 /DNA_END=3060 /DNA_ORIENTATION=+
MVISNPQSENDYMKDTAAERRRLNREKPPLVQLKLLAKSMRWKRALEILHQLIDEGFEGFSDDDIEAAFQCTLTTLGNCRRWEIARDILQTMHKHGAVVNEMSYKITLRACANANQWKPALELLDEMEEKGFHIDQVAYGTAINACAKARKYKKASELLQSMLDSGMRPSQITYNNVLSAYARSGKWEETMDRVKAMPEYGLYPDACTYNNVILACERAGQWESALETLNVMEQNGIGPDVVSYNTVISACTKCKRANEALEIFRQMESKGVEPDTITYNSVISALASRGKWESAVELLEDLRSKPERGKVDHYTYNAAIHACANGLQWELALELLSGMKEQGVCPDTYTYNTVLNAMGRAGEHIAARSLLESMTKNGPWPDSVSYSVVVTACERANDWEAAVLTFQELRESGKRVTRHCVSSVIIALGKGGQVDAALDIFYNMRNDGLKPNTHCFSAILRVCERHNKVDEALKLLDMMEASKNAHLYAYTVTIHACEAAGRFEDACSVIERMQKMGDSIEKSHLDMQLDKVSLSQWHRCLKLLGGRDPELENETTYRAAVTSCARVGHWREAKALVEKMETLGYECDNLIYSAVIGALEVGGQKEKALELFHTMVKEGVDIDAVSATSALAACAELKEADEANKILNMAIKADVVPTKKMFIYAVRASAGANTPCKDNVINYLYLMKNYHANPDEQIFVEAMKACNSKGEWEVVVRLLKEMQLEPFNVEPTERVYYTAMGILEENECFTEADKILNVAIKAGAIIDPAHQISLDFYSCRDITPGVVKVLTRRVVRYLPETLKNVGFEEDMVFITGIGQAGHPTFMAQKRPSVIEVLEEADPSINADKSFWNPGRVIVRTDELKRWFQAKQVHDEQGILMNGSSNSVHQDNMLQDLVKSNSIINLQDNNNNVQCHDSELSLKELDTEINAHEKGSL